MVVCSVIMPLYNKEEEVASCISSVLAQTFKDFELIVVNDGSSDLSVQVVESFKDSRISLINQHNLGVSAARNTGVQHAQSELLVFIDADDLWHQDFLSTIIALRDDFPQAKWFATGYEIKHSEIGWSFSKLRGLSKGFYRGILPDYFAVAICSDPPVNSSAMGVMRDALSMIGGFPVNIGSGEDLLTWARLAVRYPLAYEVRSCSVFRVSTNHRRADPENKVGQALKQLVDDYPAEHDLRAYLGLWYRMQAVMALRFGDASLARKCALQAVRYGPKQLRNAYMLLLALMPAQWRKTLDRQARNLLGKKQEKCT